MDRRLAPRTAEHFNTFYLASGILLQMFHCLSDFTKRQREWLLHFENFGVGSLPVVAIATGFTGLVMTSEIAWHMDFALSNVSMIPGFTGQFVLREIGIAVPALLLVSKVGAAITAEVASMKNTDQIEAIRILGMNLNRFYFFPRFIGCVFSTVCLTFIAIAITLLFAMFTATTRYHFNSQEYLNALSQFLNGLDFFCAMTKALVFGVVIPPICFAYGLRSAPSAQGVGQATTDAVVACTLTIITLDFLLTAFFSAVL